MKTWKKIVGLALAATMAVGLVGCGQEKQAEQSGGEG